MKYFFDSIIKGLCILAPLLSLGQEIITIRVSVPNKTDNVYIVGGQDNLGNWQPDKVKLNSISEYEREISLNLSLPAEFKFTRGSWESEGYINNYFEDAPNIVLESSESVSFEIKSWKDRRQKTGYFKYDFEIEYQFSKILGEERAIAIKLPSDYNPNQEYSVIYVLDAHDLLNPFLVTTELLSKQKIGDGIDYGLDNIPKVIVVGIIHNHRNKDVGPKMDYKILDGENVLTESSNNFKDYLFLELVPTINRKYKTSGYNIIVGHSNSGHFVLNLPLFQNNPFNGIIALSVNGENVDYSNNIQSLLKTTNNRVFLGYGLVDEGFNELAISLENQIKNNEFTNENIKIESFIANHNQLPALSASSALKFLFHDYKNQYEFLKESKKEDFSLEDYFKTHIEKQKKYGVNTKISSGDVFSILEMTVKQNDIDLFRKIVAYNDAQNDKLENHFVFWLAKEIKDYETADQVIEILLKTKNEEDVFLTYVNYKTYLEYLLDNKKSPEKALALFKNMFQNTEDYKLEFAFIFAKVAFENNIDLKQARKYKEYCKKNFTENRVFDKFEIEKLNVN
ncbi:MAG: alpha/beta hydrolase-fold protein [Luteibaculaceae bacterium]